jgi:hypothetical protein
VPLARLRYNIGRSTCKTLPGEGKSITIEQQEGRGFAGRLASARASDPLIGRIRSDGRRLHMVDDDGTLTVELLGAEGRELCRTEVTPHSMNVYCATLTRTR